MKKFLQELLIFVLLIATIGCFYLSTMVTFSTLLINLLLFFTAIFLLIQVCGIIDRIKGFGTHINDNNDNNEPSENLGSNIHEDDNTYEGDDEI